MSGRRTKRTVPSVKTCGVTKAESHGLADFRCNVCGNVVKRAMGWKVWTPSYCESTGKNARLYRISAPQ